MHLNWRLTKIKPLRGTLSDDMIEKVTWWDVIGNIWQVLGWILGNLDWELSLQRFFLLKGLMSYTIYYRYKYNTSRIWKVDCLLIVLMFVNFWHCVEVEYFISNLCQFYVQFIVHYVRFIDHYKTFDHLYIRPCNCKTRGMTVLFSKLDQSSPIVLVISSS